MGMIGVAYALLVAPVLLLLGLSPVSELLALFRRSAPDARAPVAHDETPSLLFLVPAHDEERLIGACVRSILELEYPSSRRALVVIADNCTDATPHIARAAGARCLERHDPDRPGKPAAIAWALERLEGEAWEACVIIDADTVVDPRFAAMLAAHLPLEDKCVQAYNDLSNEEDSWLTRLAGLLTRIRYERTYPLRRAKGLNCPLTGDGMCIGRNLLAAGWPAFSLTENWELYAKFTADGVSIDYEPGARLYHEEASSLSEADTQRRRWLAGRLWVLRRYLGRVLDSERIGFHQKLDVVAELASPPPVLHGLTATAIAVTAPFVLPTGPGLLVLVVAGATLMPFLIHGAAVVRAHPHRWRIAASLLLLPGYAVWRFAVAFRTLSTLREARWRKTTRAEHRSHLRSPPS